MRAIRRAGAARSALAIQRARVVWPVRHVQAGRWSEATRSALASLRVGAAGQGCPSHPALRKQAIPRAEAARSVLASRRAWAAGQQDRANPPAPPEACL
ncbi:hypothetical protein GCM10027575_03270 [Phytohabitans suffuscus]